MLWVGFFCNTGRGRRLVCLRAALRPAIHPGKRADFWAQMITFTEVSALAVAV